MTFSCPSALHLPPTPSTRMTCSSEPTLLGSFTEQILMEGALESRPMSRISEAMDTIPTSMIWNKLADFCRTSSAVT